LDDIKADTWEYNEKERLQVHFCTKVWNELIRLLDTLPRCKILKEVLLYDIAQMINGKYFSALVNLQPVMINSAEDYIYGPHSMHAVIFLSIDMMATETVDLNEMGILRSIFWSSSVMARISNCVVTWKREAKAKDFSNLIFGVGIEEKIIKPDELSSLPTDQLCERISKSQLENHLLDEWINRKKFILSFKDTIKSVNLEVFAQQNEMFLQLHLACKGQI